MADVMDAAAAPPDPSPSGSPPPPPQRKRERDSKERRSPPPPPPRGDRERDYRRRSSPSPPPYYRRSLPRRSPPPFKRSRRDDGGYDRRRGSPRGGFGSDDRRYDYDYRSGYGDDRFPARHGHRGSDWMDLGRDNSNLGISRRDGLMTYKQFIQELEDDILPSEAERRYEEYRSEYISTQKRVFFEAHKEEEWFKNMYHPTNLVAVIDRRNGHAREIAKEFLQDLQNGLLDLGPGATASLSRTGHGSAPNSDDEADPGDKRKRNGRGTGKESDLVAAPKVHPVTSEPRRIQADLALAQALIRKLDSEKGIEDNILSTGDRKKLEGEKSHDGSIGPIVIVRGPTTVKGLEGVELLDTLITYLWRIHGVDYYGMKERTEPKGFRHIRTEDADHEKVKTSSADWEKKLESFWQDRLEGQDPLELMTAKDKIDAASVEVLDPHVRKIRDEKYGWKYGCGAKGCTKLFHASEFVHKHLRLKHQDLVLELTLKVREDLYFQNYMNDADAPGGTPVMQQPLVRERVPRRRPISERLRDERGIGRGLDRSDKSPSHDHDMNNGRPDGDNPDELYDAYDGQGLHGAPPFPSDVPHPPVLMPVPGAGPLGPFVPAPPEVAMRMMREQGGPPPFEGNSGPRGRKGRSGPPMGGPAPILSMSPFPHDPRRLRSYQDLDAPEDEVTVIDYRSI